MQFEYPLKWNNQIPRTTRPIRSRFGSRSVSSAGNGLALELSHLGGNQIVITSNLKTKFGGGFYAQQNRIDDAGICVYLNLKGKEKCFADCVKCGKVLFGRYELLQHHKRCKKKLEALK